MPPVPTDEDAPPEAQSVPDLPPVEAETPAGFWTELVAAIRQELRPPVSGFFVTTSNAPVQCALTDNQVVLRCNNKFTLEMVSKPEILALVSRKASAILGRTVTAKAVDQSEKPKNNAQMERLMRFSREHSDIVNIKE